MRCDVYQNEGENLVHNIIFLRKQHGFTKKEMAKILGIGIKSLNKLENGEFSKRVTVKILFNIYDYFQIKPQDLLGQRFKNSTHG